MNKLLMSLLLVLTGTSSYADEEAQQLCITQFSSQCQTKCQEAMQPNCAQQCQEDAINQCRQAGE